MIIRRARPGDIEQLLALGREAMERGADPRLRISPAKMRAMAVYCLSGAGNFALVCEDEAGKIHGAVVAFVDEMLFYERRQANVVQFYCTAPGWGVKMLRELIRWAWSRPIIRAVVFTLEVDVDPRVAKLLERLGIERSHPVYMGIKGVIHEQGSQGAVQSREKNLQSQKEAFEARLENG